MAEQKKSNNTIIDVRDQFLLPVGRLVFQDLFTPKAWNEGDQPKYSATMIWPPEETFDAYKAAVERLKKHEDFSKLAVTPGSPEEAQRLQMGLSKDDIVYADAFIKGLAKAIKKETNITTLEKYPYMQGQFKATATSYYPPSVLDNKRDKITINEKELIYGGCYGQLLVSVGIHNKDKIFLRLHAFQKQKNGEQFARGGAGVDLNQFKTFQEDDYGNSLAEEDNEV